MTIHSLLTIVFWASCEPVLKVLISCTQLVQNCKSTKNWSSIFDLIEETMALCCIFFPVTPTFCCSSGYLVQDLAGNLKFIFVIQKVPPQLTGLQELLTCLYNPWKHRKSYYWPLCLLGGVNQAILDPSLFKSGLNFANSSMIQLLCAN